MNLLTLNLKQTATITLLLILSSPAVVIAEVKAAHDIDNDPTWIIDPKSTGPDLPPDGRSLFDFLVADNQAGKIVFNIPFPFSALLDKIEQQLKYQKNYPAIKKVLIPLGRSLQRPAAGKDFFDYPRAIAAIDTEPRELPQHAGMLLKDRLYLGYHEKANVLEVISYNETAGRFEFQLVKNYREGGTPEVYYAPRIICTACHQNHAPIFSRPTWEETSANPTIKKYLKASGKSFYGFDLDHGVDIPNAIDDATDRANLFSLQQWLWRKGCGLDNTETSVKCRAGLLTAILQYRLSGKLHFDEASSGYLNNVVAVIQENWQKYWAQGIAIPNPDIPNRDPFLKQVKTRPVNAQSLNLIDVETSFEPIKSRQPLEIRRFLNTETINDIVIGLSDFVSSSDIKRLDRHINKLISTDTIRSIWKAECQTKQKETDSTLRISFDCSKNDNTPQSFSLRGRCYLSNDKFNRCTIEQLQIGNSRHKNIYAANGIIASSGIILTLKTENSSVYLSNGSLIESIHFKWQQSSTSKNKIEAELKTIDTFSPVITAINTISNQTLDGNSDVLTSRTFRRSSAMSALFENLNMPLIKWCCEDTAGLPPARLEIQPGQAIDQKITQEIPTAFIENCAHCHFSRERFPPNFLYGNSDTVKSNLSQCAERIYYRLGMWRLDPSSRPKTAMPPDLSLLRQNTHLDAWKESTTLDELNNYISEILKQQTGKEPKLDDFIARDYESLRVCLH